MTLQERREQIQSFLGKVVDIEIDRPIGTVHEKNGNHWKYPINYGYIPRVFGGDGEELDVYLLGVHVPVDRYRCRIIGAVLRDDDDEDKLIGAPEEMVFSVSEMESMIRFQEKYHRSHIINCKENLI